MTLLDSPPFTTPLPRRLRAWSKQRKRLPWEPSSPSRSARLSDLAEYGDDPAGYARDILGLNWWAGQIEVAESVRVNRKTLVQAGHGVGKTHESAGLVQWAFDSFAPSITLTTAPNWASVRDLLWAEISAQRRKAGLPLAAFAAFHQGIPTMLRRSELHYARGHNAKSGEGFQGRHGERIMIVLDEAPGVPIHIWRAVNSMLQSDEARILAIGNPTVTSGPYFDASHDPTWNVVRLSALDHPNITAELAGEPPPIPDAVRLVWVAEMLDANCLPATGPEDADCFEFPASSGKWWRPNDEFRSRVMGLAPKQASNAVWSEAALSLARTNILAWSEQDPPEIGCDVARFGDDKTVLYARRGPCVLAVKRLAKRDTQEVAGACIEMAKALGERFERDPRKIEIKVDDDGIGGGVTDAIKAAEYWQSPVKAGSTALEEERYPNRRSELWFSTAERGQGRRLDLTRLSLEDYNLLKADLQAPTYKLNGKGQRVVEPKVDLKKRLGRSPDDGDGFNLAFAPGPPPAASAAGPYQRGSYHAPRQRRI